MRKPGSKGLDTLRNLHSAAIQLLAERSYQGMNLRLLASKLGLQAGSLYNYIESKQQLLFWLMKETTENLLRGFDAEIAPIGDAEQQMLRFVAYHVGYHIANRKEASVLATEMHSLTPQNFRAVTQLQRLYTDQVQAIVERGMATNQFSVADSRIATFVLIQMLTSVARWYSPRGRLSADQLIAVYTDLAFALLGARRGPDVAKGLNGGISNALANGSIDTAVTHSVDLGSHVLHISLAPQRKRKRSKNRAPADDPDEPTIAPD